jgi:hypothetical protein
VQPIGVRCRRPHGVPRPMVAPTVVGRRSALQGLLAAYLLAPSLLSPVEAQTDPEALAQQAFNLFHGSAADRQKALDLLVASGRADAAPILILALRFAASEYDTRLVNALRKLTGAKPGNDWAAWMLWQEAHQGIGVLPGFAKLQARVYDLIDPNFQLFLSGEVQHEIRLEEITWGGVIKDGIPALTNPRLISASAASYLTADDLVFGVAINGDVRAYPLRIMDWHEMFNDVIGGVPVSLRTARCAGRAYCSRHRSKAGRNPSRSAPRASSIARTS